MHLNHDPAWRSLRAREPLNRALKLPLHVMAGRGSRLHHQHGVYLQIAAVATLPENYAERLSEVFTGEFEKLRLLVLDPYDLALSKLERNSDVDIEDVKHLARAANFDLNTLAERYRTELRPFVAGPQSRHDLTLTLWEPPDATPVVTASRVRGPTVAASPSR